MLEKFSLILCCKIMGLKRNRGYKFVRIIVCFCPMLYFFCPIRCFWGAKVGGMGCVFFATMLQNRNSRESCLTLFSSVDACRTRRTGYKHGGVSKCANLNDRKHRGTETQSFCFLVHSSQSYTLRGLELCISPHFCLR